MSCANSVLPVFMTKPSPQDPRGKRRAIQIRPSNEVPEILMGQTLPGEFGSANRTVVVDYMTSRIAKAESPKDFGKPLRYDKFGLWRYRVRDFRIVCELQEARQVVLVVGVGHRRDVYE